MSRQNVTPASSRHENTKITQKPPSFKLTGLIVLSVLAIMLFGFSPQVRTRPAGPIGQVITDISHDIGKAIHNATDVIRNHL